MAFEAAAAATQRIRLLLSHGHQPLVKVGQSSVAGRGVFLTTPYAAVGEILCLYPGTYTPPLPTHASADSEYLANQTAPSGGLLRDNAYILNLQTVGGYIDGNVDPLTVPNPSGCGQLVNHSSSEPNVEVVSFRYSSILKYEDGTDCEEFDVPNRLRNDGSPWYFDADVDEVITLSGLDDKVMLCGAAFVASRDLVEDDELLLDYGLRSPLPPWAASWYR